MSSSVGIICVVKSVQLLIEGISELHYAIQQAKELESVDGKVCDVDFTFQNEHGEKIGVRQKAEGGVEFVVANPRSLTARKSIDRVTQAYARLKVLNEVKQKGYQNVKEEKLPDGSIRLVVQKWQ